MSVVFYGGEERIRTSDTLRYTVFPGPRTRPTMRPLHAMREEYTNAFTLTTVQFEAHC